MSPIVWLEALGALACLIGAAVVWRRPDPRFPATRAILLVLLLAQVGLRILEALEWSGWTELSQTGETLSVVVPLLWLFVVKSLATELLLARTKRREQQLSLVLQQVPVGLAVLDSSGTPQLSNARWNATQGAASLGLPPAQRAPFAAEAARLLEHIRAGGGPASVGAPIAAGDAWVRLSAAPWSLTDAIGGFVVLAEDVSREVYEEEQTRQHIESLHHGNRIELLNLIAASTVHDLRNSLTILTVNVDLLACGFLSPDEEKASIESMHTALEMSNTLMENLAQFGRVQTPDPVPIKLAAFIRDNRRLLAHSLSRRVQLDLALGEVELEVQAVPVHLQQILLNLVINARDAMPDGGTVTVLLAPATAPGEDGSTRALLSVRDEGVGIAPEVAARIFEPLFTTKGPQHGTGLGLSIVDSLVKGMSGHIAVTSAPGEGATFAVSLPAQVQSARATG